MIVYIDDILVMVDTAAQVKSNLEALILLLTSLMSALKYNFQMAQIMQRLHAIWERG